MCLSDFIGETECLKYFFFFLLFFFFWGGSQDPHYMYKYGSQHDANFQRFKKKKRKEVRINEPTPAGWRLNNAVWQVFKTGAQE